MFRTLNIFQTSLKFIEIIIFNLNNMGNYSFKTKEKNYNFSNYYCLKCGKIPLLHFMNYTFDIICSKHKILNVPILKYYDFTNYYYKCCICSITDETEKYFFFVMIVITIIVINV